MPHAKGAKDAKGKKVAARLEKTMATKNTQKERGTLCVLWVLCGYFPNNFFATFAALA